jgi:lipopolysaccharide export system protein LptA
MRNCARAPAGRCLPARLLRSGLAWAVLGLLAPQLVSAQEPPEPVESAVERFGLSLDSTEQMKIRADQLQVKQGKDGRELVVFENAVEAVQGGLSIHCDWLEALYPSEGGSSGGAERITARGSVVIRQPGMELRCASAVLDRPSQRATCRGGEQPALLSRGDDVVTGREIELDGATGLFKVRGGATVTISPGGREDAEAAPVGGGPDQTPAPAPPPGEGGP